MCEPMCHSTACVLALPSKRARLSASFGLGGGERVPLVQVRAFFFGCACHVCLFFCWTAAFEKKTSHVNSSFVLVIGV